MKYALSYKVQGDILEPSTILSVDSKGLEITCAQLVWLRGLVAGFSLAMSSSSHLRAATPWPLLSRPLDQNHTTQADHAPGGTAQSAGPRGKLEAPVECEMQAASIEGGRWQLSRRARFSFRSSDLSIVVRNFSRLPLLRLGVRALEVTGQVSAGSSSVSMACSLDAHVRSEARHAWEPAVEPCHVICALTCLRDAALREDLGVKSENFLTISADNVQTSIAPDHVYSLAQAAAQLEIAVRSLRTDPAVSRAVLHHDSGRQGADLSKFFGEFMPVERVLLMNSTSLLLNVQIVTADGMDNWEAPIQGRSSVMVPKALLQEYGLQFLAAGGVVGGGTYTWSQTIFLLPQAQAHDARTPDQAVSDPGAASVLQTAVLPSADSCEIDAAPLRLKLRSSQQSILIHCPFVVENLCPQDICVALYASRDPEAKSTGLTAEIHAGSSQEQYSVDAASEVFMAVALKGFTALSRARLCLHGLTDCDRCLHVKDGMGRVLEMRLKLYEDINGDTVVCVFPQMVIINRTQVKLQYGRCRQLQRSPGAAGETVIDSDAAVDNMAESLHQQGANGRQDETLTDSLHVVEAAGPPDVETPVIRGLGGQGESQAAAESWHACPPQVLMFSLPEGPDWSPCLRLWGSGKWARISRSEFAEVDEEDGDEPDRPKASSLPGVNGGALRLVSRLRLIPTDDNPSASNCVDLGVEIRVGASSFCDSVYMEIMPEVTFINRSPFVLRIAREHVAVGSDTHGAAKQAQGVRVEPGQHLPSTGAFVSAPHDAPVRYRLAIVGGPEDGDEHELVSCPFGIASDRFFPLSLALVREEGRADASFRAGDKKTVNVKVKRLSAATFVSFGDVDERAPLYQVRNLCVCARACLRACVGGWVGGRVCELSDGAPLQVRNLCSAHHVHVWQPSPMAPGASRALSVAPGMYNVFGAVAMVMPVAMRVSWVDCVCVFVSARARACSDCRGLTGQGSQRQSDGMMQRRRMC